MFKHGISKRQDIIEDLYSEFKNQLSALIIDGCSKAHAVTNFELGLLWAKQALADERELKS